MLAEVAAVGAVPFVVLLDEDVPCEAQERGGVGECANDVGAAFDFSAGTAKRAPRWMQECYMEWLYRLMQDPKRLFHRYFTTNVRFVLLNLFRR